MIRKPPFYGKTVAFLLSIFLILMSGCNALPSDDIINDVQSDGNGLTDIWGKEETIPEADRYITFDSDTLSICGVDADGMVDYLTEIGQDNCVGIWEDSKGEVCLAVNEEQVVFWEAEILSKLERMEKTIQDVSRKYHCDFSKDYTVINLYYDLWYSSIDALAFMEEICSYCVVYQRIMGNDDFALTINVYNTDTGNLVDTGEVGGEGINYGNDEWYESYCLSMDEEERVLEEADQAAAYHIDSAFYEPIPVVRILNKVNANIYSYLFIDEKGSLVIGLTEDERESWIDACQNFLSNLSQEFSVLGDSYCIEYENNWSKINIYFDENLSSQEQVDYMVYSEEISMILQTLCGEEFFVEMNIYNSQTGELVSSGDTIDGIEWKME